MTAPAPIAPPPGVTGWKVVIPMPRFEDGRLRGELVGWLTTNNIASTVRTKIDKDGKVQLGKIDQDKARRLWREAAWKQYALHRLPKGLGRIYVTLQYETTPASRLRDSPNMEVTAKPIIDALQPEKIVVVKKTSTQRHIGWGVVPDDRDEWVQRGPHQPWLRTAPDHVGGRVHLNIIPFPATPPQAA